ncbi:MULTISPECIES: anthrone oxygenase family protein [unclassified Micromonospora]|uniref:anthrone oxygenase family protein n=1 Tax=unclassified Micromonospora TaxID=2617518 RepID=UPI0033AC174A
MSTLAAWSAAVTLAVTGLIAGVYYAFSVSVMPGLNATDAGTAIRAMTSINQKIQNPLFFVTFFGPILAATITGVLLLILGHRPAALLFFLAGAAYLVGAFIPTVTLNVPMNDALDATGVPTDPAEAARIWADYASRWTWWNTVRAGASVVSLLLAGFGVYLWGSQR